MHGEAGSLFFQSPGQDFINISDPESLLKIPPPTYFLCISFYTRKNVFEETKNIEACKLM